ncbi:MAG: phosphate ABC transporter permease PstA [Ignavibacteriae bacterium]|nr:phosphate ABC transporter permease PstA [Ignavibacteriota bacterium]
MTSKNPLRDLAAALGSVLLAVAVLAALLLLLPWYSALGGVAVIVAGVTLLWRRLGMQTKRSVSENIFVILSGSAAFIIIIFVVYFLIHIFLLGKENLSWSFFFEAPAEGLTEGGIFPAIIGTAMLVIIMALAGVPVGTITAIYLTEYASERSIIARFIRFAVNTLAGVPAIVFGLFGLGFFIGTVGKQMDTWSRDSRMQRIEQIFSTGTSPFSDDGKATTVEVKRLFESDDSEYWAEQIDGLKIMDEVNGAGALIERARYMTYYADASRPKWGQPALIWAALTMALLTLPVVIVSVEEAIKAVPKDLREASLALGATKWETIRRVVIPGAFTGIMTGGILAVSRGAGEVAPILFTGAAYYLPELPGSLSSQFMELGYHIYVLTTQSTDVEATKPLLYATTFTLLILTFALNFSAIFLRSRIRARLNRLGQ